MRICADEINTDGVCLSGDIALLVIDHYNYLIDTNKQRLPDMIDSFTYNAQANQIIRTMHDDVNSTANSYGKSILQFDGNNRLIQKQNVHTYRDRDFVKTDSCLYWFTYDRKTMRLTREESSCTGSQKKNVVNYRYDERGQMIKEEERITGNICVTYYDLAHRERRRECFEDGRLKRIDSTVYSEDERYATQYYWQADDNKWTQGRVNEYDNKGRIIKVDTANGPMTPSHNFNRCRHVEDARGNVIESWSYFGNIIIAYYKMKITYR